MKKLSLLLFTFLPFTNTLLAQVAPNIVWNKTFGANSFDALSYMEQTADGGYILGGSSFSQISGDKTQASKGGEDYWVVKLDGSGNKIWDKTYGGAYNDNLSVIKQTSDGGYILGGSSESDMSGDKSEPNRGTVGVEDYWIVKLDANGNKIWDKTFGSNSWDNLYALQQTSDGGYIIGGLSQSGVGGDKSQPVSGDSDFWVIKINSNGTKVWDKTYGGNNGEVLTSLLQTPDGGFLFAGYSGSGISGDKSQASQGVSDYWIIKVDANGLKQWDKSFGSNYSDFLISIEKTQDGGYIIGGFSNSLISTDKSEPSKGGFDMWVLKLDALGNKIWDKTLGGGKGEDLAMLKQTPDKGYLLGGTSTSGIGADKSQDSLGRGDYWIIKIDSLGNKQWDKTIGGNASDIMTNLVRCADGSFVLGGFSKTDINGDKSQPSQGDFDYWVVKLSSNLLGINEFPAAQINLYPNPSSGIFNLSLQYQATFKIAIYNSLGQCILKKSNTSTEPKPLQLDLSNSAKGIYTIQVITGKQSIIKKVILE